jgi:hypothetical protein
LVTSTMIISREYKGKAALPKKPDWPRSSFGFRWLVAQQIRRSTSKMRDIRHSKFKLRAIFNWKM